MTASLRTLTGDSLAQYLYLYCASRRKEQGSVEKTDPDFLTFLKEKGATVEADPLLNNQGYRKFSDNLTRLAPDWDRRRKNGQIRMKTFLKIYLSKWFWKGLEWQEVEFVNILLDRYHDTDLTWIKSDRSLLINRKGFQVVMEMSLEDEKKSFYAQGIDLMEMADTISYIFTLTDFQAVWKLRSVQSLRDHLFVKVTGHEHEGKLGIIKPRIRGYRDGKASPRDPTLTKMARKVDQLFYEAEFEARWEQFEIEVKRYSSS